MRIVGLSWLILLAVASILSAIVFIDPDQALMDRIYRSQRLDSQSPVPVSFEASTSRHSTTNRTKDKGELEIAVPVLASGVADGHAAVPVAFKASLEAAGGLRWESLWQVVYNERYFPGISDSTMSFRIRQAVYDRFKSKAVTLHLTFAVDEVKLVATRSMPLSTSEFFVSGFGVCTPQSPWFKRAPEITGITCRSAMRQPQLTYVTVNWTDADCSVADSEKVLGSAWAGSLETDPAEFGITSVWETPLSLSNNWGTYHEGETPYLRHICPGSPVTFSTYDRVERTQVELTIQNFRLPDLAIGDVFLLQMK
jgi:hypothetical protein